MEYTSVGIPRTFRDRFHKIQSFFGYRTFSEFVVEITRQKLHEMEVVHDIREMEKKNEL